MVGGAARSASCPRSCSTVFLVTVCRLPCGRPFGRVQGGCPFHSNSFKPTPGSVLSSLACTWPFCSPLCLHCAGRAQDDMCGQFTSRGTPRSIDIPLNRVLACAGCNVLTSPVQRGNGAKLQCVWGCIPKLVKSQLCSTGGKTAERLRVYWHANCWQITSKR